MKQRRRGPIPVTGTGFLLLGVTAIALLATLPTVSSADEENLPEIPLTSRMPVAARYAGMGGAALAIADDYSACLANPATLGLVRAIEFAIGFTHQSGERDIRFLGDPASTEFGKTRLSHLGFAYPFPTYRGRFVLGFQYGRISSLDSDFFKEGAGSGVIREQEGIYEEGSLNAYAMSAAIQVSPNVTLGATGTVLGGNDFRERTFFHETEGELISSFQSYDADITGITGSVGALVELSQGIRLGMTVNFPESIDFDGEVFYEDRANFEEDRYSFTDEIDMPFRLGAGLAMARSNFILAADAIFTDWTQISFAGPLRTGGRDPAYRETVEFHLGAEYLLSPPVPIRLRAGYSYQPLAYNLLLTDVVTPRYHEARFETDRQYITGGVGFLLGETVTMDLAYMHGGYERSAPGATNARYTEEEKDRRVLATVSLRLN